jgi:hypothetical protein
MLAEAMTPGAVAGAFGLAVIILMTSTFFKANQRTAATVQRFGGKEEQPCYREP